MYTPLGLSVKEPGGHSFALASVSEKMSEEKADKSRRSNLTRRPPELLRRTRAVSTAARPPDLLCPLYAVRVGEAVTLSLALMPSRSAAAGAALLPYAGFAPGVYRRGQRTFQRLPAP